MRALGLTLVTCAKSQGYEQEVAFRTTKITRTGQHHLKSSQHAIHELSYLLFIYTLFSPNCLWRSCSLSMTLARCHLTDSQGQGCQAPAGLIEGDRYLHNFEIQATGEVVSVRSDHSLSHSDFNKAKSYSTNNFDKVKVGISLWYH